MIVPAVTMMYFTMPSFRVVYYDRNTGRIMNYKVFAADVSVADGKGENPPPLEFKQYYEFNQAYGTHAYSGAAVSCLLQSMISQQDSVLGCGSNDPQHNKLFASYMQRMYALLPRPCDAECNAEMLCLMQFPDVNNVNKCIG